MYGDNDLARGSGVYVGQSGIVAGHHFLMPEDGSSFSFMSGTYRIELFAKTVEQRRAKCLWTYLLDVTDNESVQIQNRECGLYFDWAPSSEAYLKHIRANPNATTSDQFLTTRGVEPSNVAEYRDDGGQVSN